jgi:hypothetical protein
MCYKTVYGTLKSFLPSYIFNTPISNYNNIRHASFFFLIAVLIINPPSCLLMSSLPTFSAACFYCCCNKSFSKPYQLFFSQVTSSKKRKTVFYNICKLFFNLYHTELGDLNTGDSGWILTGRF